MKKVMVLLTAFMLFASVGAFAANSNKSQKKSQTKNKIKFGASWSVTSSCGVTYSVYYACLACLPMDVWQTQNAVQDLVDSWCGNIDPFTGFEN